MTPAVQRHAPRTGAAAFTWAETEGVPLLHWAGPAGVVAAFSGRRGGVSRGPFASLNLSTATGDEPGRVRENRRRLLAATGADASRVVWCRQTHSAAVHRAEDLPALDFVRDTGPVPAGDGLVTALRGQAVVVFAADCVPIVVARLDGRAVGVAHAGWRGLAAGVVDALVRELGDGAKAAAIGPCAGPDRYAVGPDVAAALERACGPTAVTGRGTADLAAAASAALRRAGVEAVDIAELCTIGDADRFFSHRRDGAPGGRQAAVALLGAPS